MEDTKNKYHITLFCYKHKVEVVYNALEERAMKTNGEDEVESLKETEEVYECYARDGEQAVYQGNFFTILFKEGVIPRV